MYIGHGFTKTRKKLPSIFSLLDDNKVMIRPASTEPWDDRYIVCSRIDERVLCVIRAAQGSLPFMSFRQLGVTIRPPVDDVAILLNANIEIYSKREIDMIQSFLQYAIGDINA